MHNLNSNANAELIADNNFNNYKKSTFDEYFNEIKNEANTLHEPPKQKIEFLEKLKSKIRQNKLEKVKELKAQRDRIEAKQLKAKLSNIQNQLNYQSSTHKERSQNMLMIKSIKNTFFV